MANEFDLLSSPTPTRNYVIDDAGVLNRTTKKSLSEDLTKLEVPSPESQELYQVSETHRDVLGRNQCALVRAVLPLVLTLLPSIGIRLCQGLDLRPVLSDYEAAYISRLAVLLPKWDLCSSRLAIG